MGRGCETSQPTARRHVIKFGEACFAVSALVIAFAYPVLRITGYRSRSHRKRMRENVSLPLVDLTACNGDITSKKKGGVEQTIATPTALRPCYHVRRFRHAVEVLRHKQSVTWL